MIQVPKLINKVIEYITEMIEIFHNLINDLSYENTVMLYSNFINFVVSFILYKN